ncbi:hypothetical protein [Amycolatopsis sp.]|jgi:hypothetical protein|uniref:hypothetical protein n=1 Tax=Amycolatopsis sp. TaxID=37632 RepID=UPI002636FA92|nr:hypothetical protein [Amycolatopsis sp.]
MVADPQQTDKKTAAKVLIGSLTVAGAALLTAVVAALSPHAVADATISPISAAIPAATAGGATPVTRSTGSGCSSSAGSPSTTPSPAQAAPAAVTSAAPMTRSNGS